MEVKKSRRKGGGGESKIKIWPWLLVELVSPNQRGIIYRVACNVDKIMRSPFSYETKHNPERLEQSSIPGVDQIQNGGTERTVRTGNGSNIFSLPSSCIPCTSLLPFLQIYVEL
jgi:hypothetical protein